MDAVAKDTHEKDVLLKALGFNVNLAPVCDVSTDPHDFIYDRSFGQNASRTRDYAAAVTEAMAADAMGCVLKHFPGYGNNVDTHTGIAVDKRPLETFESSDFLPFTAGLQGGADLSAVLVSHNIVQCMDPNLPASLSPAVHQRLRNLMAQAGCEDNVVMTDDLVMDAVKAYAENGSVAVLAIQAGNDLLIATDYQTQIPQVIAAVKDGTLDETLLDTACARVLRWKINLGLL
jgi:beta-N-acetylhexosaminidase